MTEFFFGEALVIVVAGEDVGDAAIFAVDEEATIAVGELIESQDSRVNECVSGN